MHRVGRALAGAAAALIAGTWSIGTAAPAQADAAGGAVTDDSGIDYGALVGTRSNNHTNSGGKSSGTKGPSCTYRLMGGPEEFTAYDFDGTVIKTAPGGHWYEKSCDGVFYGGVYLMGAPNTVDPRAVAAGVMKRMTIPLPRVEISPTGDQIVNLASWFWISNWSPITGSATVEGVTVKVTARPSSARWSFGDGSSATCAPGVPWSEASDGDRACTHVWRRSSAAQPSDAYRMSVTVNWNASFTVTGGAGGGALSPISRTTTMPVRVAEVQAINNRFGG